MAKVKVKKFKLYLEQELGDYVILENKKITNEMKEYIEKIDKSAKKVIEILNKDIAEKFFDNIRFDIMLSEGRYTNYQIIFDYSIKPIKQDINIKPLNLPQIKEIVDFMLKHNWEIYFVYWKQTF